MRIPRKLLLKNEIIDLLKKIESNESFYVYYDFKKTVFYVDVIFYNGSLNKQLYRKYRKLLKSKSRGKHYKELSYTTSVVVYSRKDLRYF